jgi:hypothetical protein
MKISAASASESRRSFLKKLVVGALALDAAGMRALVPAHAGIRASVPSPPEKAVEDALAGGDDRDSLADPGWGG